MFNYNTPKQMSLGTYSTIYPTWIKLSMILPQKLYKEKSMTNTDKDEVEGSSNLNTSIHNIMYTFFYYNIS